MSKCFGQSRIPIFYCTLGLQRLVSKYVYLTLKLASQPNPSHKKMRLRHLVNHEITRGESWLSSAPAPGAPAASL